VAAVDRALSVFAALGAAAEPQSLTQIAGATGLYKSTTLRLLMSLVHARLVHLQIDGRYRLGSALPGLLRAYDRQIDLRAICMPGLARLAEETGESAIFFIREGDSRVCLLRVDGRHNVREHIPTGTALPLNVGAAGRALTTSFDWSRVVRQPPAFESYGERDSELAAIAAPVFGPDRRLVGALCLSGTIARFKSAARHKELRKAVVRGAVKLTEALGGNV
jgi:DNA-binding IclR family transcriptional regulator